MEEIPGETTEKLIGGYQMTVNSHRRLFEESTGEDLPLHRACTLTSSVDFPPNRRFKPRFPADRITQKTKDMRRQHDRCVSQMEKIVKGLAPADTGQIMEKMVALPRKSGMENKKTLIFDLDETLVHCVQDPTEGEIVISFQILGKTVEVGVNIRPFAKACLEIANRYFEVVVFTASLSCYADRVLDLLDPTGTLIQHRMYREHCVVTDGLYIKDLRVFADKNMREVALVDNSLVSCAYQRENGIIVVSWYDDKDDTELCKLMRWLPKLSKSADIRAGIRDYIQSSKNPPIDKENESPMTFAQSFLRLFI